MQTYCLESQQDMANYDERIKGLETTAGNVRERLAALEGKSSAILPTPKTTHPILIPFVSIVFSALLLYLGWMGTQIVDYGRKLTAIETKLTLFGLQSQASLPQPAFEKALPEIRSAVAAARKDRISAPPTVIEGLRSKLLASNSEAAEYWPTLAEFVSYRSSLSYHVVASPAIQVGQASFKMLPNCTDSLPTPMKVVSPNQMSIGVYENCRFVLDSATQDQTLNAILKGSTPIITFKNCLIEYHGGEINLILAWDKEPFSLTIVGRGEKDPTKTVNIAPSGPAINFENCLFSLTFQNPPPPNGQRLSTTLLAQNATFVSFPVSP